MNAKKKKEDEFKNREGELRKKLKDYLDGDKGSVQTICNETGYSRQSLYNFKYGKGLSPDFMSKLTDFFENVNSGKAIFAKEQLLVPKRRAFEELITMLVRNKSKPSILEKCSNLLDRWEKLKVESESILSEYKDLRGAIFQ